MAITRVLLGVMIGVLTSAFSHLSAYEFSSGGIVALPADEKDDLPCGGAGVIISADGKMLTLLEAMPLWALNKEKDKEQDTANAEQKIKIILPGGKLASASILKRGVTSTAVLLQLHTTIPFSVVPLGDSRMAQLGHVVWTAGNAFGALELDGVAALSRGMVSGHYSIPSDSPPVRGRGGRELSTYRGEVFEIDAAINDGNQGGAVLDNAGRLIGLASLGSTRPRKLGTAIPLHIIAADVGITLPMGDPPSADPQTQALVRSASDAANGLVLVYMERTSGPGNPPSIPRPPRVVEDVSAHERPRIENWWAAYYHQQQMFYTDQAITAVVIDAQKGILLTANSHLHGGAKRGEILLPSGAISCTVLARHLPLDLALLKADKALPVAALRLAESPQLSLGQPIAVVGRHVGDNGFTCTTGVVSTTTRRKQQTDAIFAQTDALANYGNLGGAVVDVMGSVVGMIVWLGPDADDLPWMINSGVSLFVDSSTILRALPALIEGKTTRRSPIIGLGIQMAYPRDNPGDDKREKPRENQRSSDRPIITAVTPGTGAEAAGMKADDILMRVDGVDATSPLAVTRALVRRREGDIIPVVVERDGDQVTLQVQIRAFSDDP
jgi:S1-C subfamily serine protease